jgi:hypothetical protein
VYFIVKDLCVIMTTSSTLLQCFIDKLPFKFQLLQTQSNWEEIEHAESNKKQAKYNERKLGRVPNCRAKKSSDFNIEWKVVLNVITVGENFKLVCKPTLPISI